MTGDLGAVRVRRSLRAKRLTLQVKASEGVVELVIPRRVSEAQAQRFAARHQGWILRQQSKLRLPQAFAPGLVLSVLGNDKSLIHDPSHHGVGLVQEDKILVGGQGAFFNRRVTDTLKKLAYETIAPLVRAQARAIGCPVKGIAIKDTHTRWGSCSPDGRLSFSWRLILAPLWVVEYVAAHEVAHLVELNHSAAFWATVDRLTPHRQQAEAWLKVHGAQLHQYGRYGHP